MAQVNAKSRHGLSFGASDTTLRMRSVVSLAGMLAAAWVIGFWPLPVVIALAALAAAGIALPRCPWLVWPLLALALPVTSGLAIGPGSATEVLILAALGLWLADGTSRRSLRVYANPVLLLILAYAGVQLLSLLPAMSLGDGVAEVVKWAEFALVLALAPSMLGQRGARWLAAALVTGGTVQALLGLYQFVYQVGPEWFVVLDRFMRASGSFRQPNPYAAYLGVLLPVTVSLSLWAWRRVAVRGAGGWLGLVEAVFYTTGSGIIGAGLLASWSRGGWMAAAAAIAVVLAVRSRKALAATAATVGLLAIGGTFGLLSPGLVPSNVSGRMQSAAQILRPAELLSQPVTDANFALIERLAHWVAGYRMWESAPWLGVGAGNYAAVYDAVRIPLWTEALGHAHNLYLNVLAETGLIGLAAFGFMWFGLGVWVWKHRMPVDGGAETGWCRAMSAGALGSLTYLSIHSLVDMLFVQGIYLGLALVLAALAAGCCTSCGRTGGWMNGDGSGRLPE